MAGTSLKTALIWVGMVTATVVLAAVLGEIGLRLFAPQPILPQLRALHPKMGKIVLPNVDSTMFRPGMFEFHIRTDGEGFRVPRDRGGSCDGPLLVVTGDSFAFGIGVEEEDTYGALLRDHIGDQWCVRNGAVPGSGMTQELAAYEYRFQSLGPAVLLLNTFANDLFDCQEVPLYLVDRAGDARFNDQMSKGKGAKQKGQGGALDSWLRTWSHLYSVFLFRGRGDPGTGQGGEHLPGRHENRPQPAEGERIFRGCLKRLARLTREDGTKLIIVTIPGQSELERGRNHVGDVVRELQAEGGYLVVDPAPELRAAQAVENIWFREGHFDSRGHRAVYDAILRVAGETLTSGGQ